MRDIYLDHLGGCPPAAEVVAAMGPWIGSASHAGAVHRRGLEARDAMALARAEAASLLGASDADSIVFTSGGTEAVNLAIKGVLNSSRARGRHLVIGATDQPAVTQSADFLVRGGVECTRLKPDSEGRLDPAMVGSALRDETALLCVHQVNHDLGTVQRVAELCAVARARGVPVLVDATASAGWLPVEMEVWGADLVAASPHRFHGPRGVGLLARSRRVALEPLIHGGVQENHLRAGTENLAAIVGAGVASRLAREALPGIGDRLRELQSRLWTGIRGAISHIRLLGPEPGAGRMPGHLNVAFEFVEGEALALSLDMQGVAVGTGPACVSRAMKVSPVLQAIGVPAALGRSNLLLTMGRGTTAAKVDEVLGILVRTVEKVRGLSPLWEDYQAGLLGSVTELGGGGEG